MVCLFRPEDFIVTEVDLNGELVVLNKDTPITPPPLDMHPSFSPQSPPTTPEDESQIHVLSEDQIISLHGLSQKWEEFAITETTSLSESINLGLYKDKETRSSIHKEVASLFPLLKTAQGNNDKVIYSTSL